MKHSADGGKTFTVRICPLGHHNPPDFPRCRVCGGVLDAPIQVAFPKLGWVRSTDQQTVELTGDLVVGRAPDTHGREGVFSLTTPPSRPNLYRGVGSYRGGFGFGQRHPLVSDDGPDGGLTAAQAVQHSTR